MTDHANFDHLTFNTVQKAIYEGDLDDDLDVILAEIADRKRRLGTAEVSVGARGVLKNGRPLYLNGAPFTVKKINQKRVVVNLDQAWLDAHPKATRWRGDVTAPMGMLDFGVKV